MASCSAQTYLACLGAAGIAVFGAVLDAANAQTSETVLADITGFWSPESSGQAPDMVLTDWAREGLAAMQEKREEAARRCLSRGVFGLDFGGPPPIDILIGGSDGDNEITIVGNNYLTFARHIYLEREHPSVDDFAPNGNGHSIGRWDDGVLLVDTVGYDTETGIGPQYAPHSGALHVVERLSLADSGATLLHEMTMTDPMALEEPYTVATRWKRAPDATPVKELCTVNRD